MIIYGLMKLTGDKKYQLLVEISQKIRDTLDLDEINTHILNTIKTVLDYDAGGIFVLNQDLVHHRHVGPQPLRWCCLMPISIPTRSPCRSALRAAALT